MDADTLAALIRLQADLAEIINLAQDPVPRAGADYGSDPEVVRSFDGE